MFKYIYKGPDKAQTVFESVLTDQNTTKTIDTNEIEEYVDARYISAIEAVWHIFHFLMHDQGPSVIRLDTHLENDQTIVYKDDEKLGEIQKKERHTKLTAWFLLNTNDLNARNHLYHDIPKYYVWKNESRTWQRRKHDKISDMIGRMYFISRFCLRAILLNATGCKSFTDLKTYNNVIYLTYHACAIARGLMQDDKIWSDTIQEASQASTDIRKLRLLFVIILIYSQPSSPRKLWDQHKNSLTEDILRNERIRLKNPTLEYNDDMFNLSI